MALRGLAAQEGGEARGQRHAALAGPQAGTMRGLLEPCRAVCSLVQPRSGPAPGLLAPAVVADVDCQLAGGVRHVAGRNHCWLNHLQRLCAARYAGAMQGARGRARRPGKRAGEPAGPQAGARRCAHLRRPRPPRSPALDSAAICIRPGAAPSAHRCSTRRRRRPRAGLLAAVAPRSGSAAAAASATTGRRAGAGWPAGPTAPPAAPARTGSTTSR